MKMNLFISPTSLISTHTVDDGEHFSSTLMNTTTNHNVEVTTIKPDLSIERVTHKTSPQFDIVLSTESESVKYNQLSYALRTSLAFFFF